uniref:Uncharacterized protein n=1 Tax=Leclercia adecarboxylata TaxID=83655 RepID=A0A482LYN3_9ENTR|nr:Hypothetical protein [Leclercia adecarboxylata]
MKIPLHEPSSGFIDGEYTSNLAHNGHYNFAVTLSVIASLKCHLF